MSETIGKGNAPTRRRQTGRSPSYPAISLPAAIERVRVLYHRERQFAAPIESVVKHWGYSTLNGPAGLAVAALKKYGLIEDEGSKDERRIKVTDLAVRILEHPMAESRNEAIREAALRPAIHREMWDEHAEDLPSDSSLIWSLSRERGFTETGAREFVREYKDTLEFAHLGASQSHRPTAPAKDDEEEPSPDPGPSGTNDTGTYAEPSLWGDSSQTSQPYRVIAASVQTYTIPVGVGENVIVQGEFPLTEPKWAQFIAVLTAMKPALVALDKVNQSEARDL